MNINLNTTLNDFYNIINPGLFFKIIIAYIFLVWISLIIWVVKDITNRTNNIFYQLISVFIIVFWTPLSIFIYLIIRPWKTILEKMFEEIDYNLDILDNNVNSNNSYENDLQENDNYTVCNACKYDKIQIEFKNCPNCWVSLKKFCSNCEKEINTKWKICPYCETKLKWEEKNEEEKEKEIKIEKKKKN